MIWVKYGFGILYGIFVFQFIKALWIAVRYSPWKKPDALVNHGGDPTPTNVIFFTRPRSDLGLILSAESTLQKERLNFLKRTIVSAIWAVVVTVFGVWLYAIDELWMQVIAFLLSWIILDTALVLGHGSCSTLVGTDGFQLQNACVGRRRLVHVSNDAICFDEVIDFCCLGDYLHVYCLDSEGMARRRQVVGTLSRPLAYNRRSWGDFCSAAEDAFLDHLWSRSLLDLAVCHDVPSDERFERGLRCHITPPPQPHDPGSSVFAMDPQTSQRERLYLGYLMFCETGLAYDESSFLANHRQLTPGDFSFFKSADVISIDTSKDTLNIKLSSRELTIPAIQCPRSRLLVRLFQSNIWTSGLQFQLESELATDLAVLEKAGWTKAPRDELYYHFIPAHRFCVWKAAELLDMEIDSDLWTVISEQSLSFRCDSLPPEWSHWGISFAEEHAADEHRRLGPPSMEPYAERTAHEMLRNRPL